MNNFILVLLCSGLTFLATILGSAIVYLFKNINLKFEKSCLGLAAGIMVSASFFSLILPSLEYDNIYLVILGIIIGCLLIFILKLLNLKIKKEDKSLFFLAVTLHNIPEGMVVGLTCSLVNNTHYSIIGDVMLAIGIAIQNIPEGIATTLPLVRNGMSKHKAFIKGILSGIVEPISAVIMFFLAQHLSNLMPLFLNLAAGSMIYVVIDELVPESKDNGINIGSIMFSIGFVVMMVLDLVL